MVEIGSKCPKCGNGPMQAVLDTPEITSQSLTTQLRARCANCGHEEDARNGPENAG